MKTSMLLLLLLIFPCFGQSADEYHLKAVFIERFFRFIEWDLKDSLSDTLKFGVIGSSTVTIEFSVYFKNIKVNDQTVELIDITNLSQLPPVDIIFVLESTPWETGEIKDTAGSNTIIIGDEPMMAEYGAIISFVIRKQKLRFRINLDNAKKNNIKISSYLLEMAEVI